MDNRQKELIRFKIEREKKLIKNIEKTFIIAKEDCYNKLLELTARMVSEENLQSLIYQQDYQRMLLRQIDGILDLLHKNNFENLDEYLTKCYEEGFIGSAYVIHGQGVPIILPIDQAKVIKAVQVESKLSKPLYKRLGEDVDKLKKDVTNELSRGTAQGKMWTEVASDIAHHMNSPFDRAMRRSFLIARTEGHRISISAQLDYMHGAKEKGADVLKQWDATLDGRTRPHHQMLDGQIREMDEDFVVDGFSVECPGAFGVAAEDCNCRCALLERARWGLDAEELETLKGRANYFNFDKTDEFEEFKAKYLDIDDFEEG